MKSAKTFLWLLFVLMATIGFFLQFELTGFLGFLKKTVPVADFIKNVGWADFFGVGKAQLPEAKVVFCNVGQGDAAYIRAPEGQDILIDGGPDDSVLSCLGKNMPFWDREIELVIFSHPEADHIFGLIEVLRRYKVDRLIWSGISKHTPVFETLIEEMNKVEAETIFELPERRIVIGNNQKIVIHFYYPLEIPSGDLDDTNDWSIVNKVSYGDQDILFTGDIMQKGTENLVESVVLSESYSDQLDVEVLKVPHHGSKNGLTAEMLEITSPEYAVISVGLNNPYGHPHSLVLDMLLNAKVKICRTDLDGDVTLITDGKGLKISKCK